MPKHTGGRPKELLDPRQALFLEYYMKPGTATFSNIYQSAIKAGYTREYAENMRIKTLSWVSENVGEVTKDELVKKSKRILNKSLDSSDEKLAQDTAKFVAKTDIEFSEKTDITSNGKDINQILVKFIGDDTKND
jgi:phage terminase small subunit